LRLAAIVEFSDAAIIGHKIDIALSPLEQGSGKKIFAIPPRRWWGCDPAPDPEDGTREEIHIMEKIGRGESANTSQPCAKTKAGG